ncbi:hypothetical protein KIK15_05305 [Williamsia sp. CHRR-6]|nr:hypothetical protein [Williamsia sp. CHRR-6]
MRAAVAKAVAGSDVTRLVVLAPAEGSDAFCAAVASRLLVAERLDVELAYVAPKATAGTAVWGLPHGHDAITLAGNGTAQELPLIRDDAAVVIIGSARHSGVDGELTGESIVDNERLFLGTSRRDVLIRPTRHQPGVQGALARRWRSPRWVSGRAVQTGGVDIVVERDGVRAPRPVKRSTIYCHHEPWKLVCP